MKHNNNEYKKTVAGQRTLNITYIFPLKKLCLCSKINVFSQMHSRVSNGCLFGQYFRRCPARIRR